MLPLGLGLTSSKTGLPLLSVKNQYQKDCEVLIF